MPETRARISTSREPSALPTASSERGTFSNPMRFTVTGTAGVPAPGAALAPESHPASHGRASARAAARAAWRKRGLEMALIGIGGGGTADSRYYTYLPVGMLKRDH